MHDRRAGAASGFAYDNERPRHRTDVRGYLIGAHADHQRDYLTFVEGGGYERREWWSDEGWAWKEEYDITRPGGWTADHRAEWRLARLEPLDPHRPVVHISWFEADAFARAHGAPPSHRSRVGEGGDLGPGAGSGPAATRGATSPPLPGVHANIDQLDVVPARPAPIPPAPRPTAAWA